MPNDSRIQSALSTPLKKDEAATWGVQNPLILWDGPAGTEAQHGLPLIGLTLSVNGVYQFLINTSGLASALNVHVLPQLTTATLTSAGPDLISITDPITDDPTASTVLVSGTGDGALSDDTLQTASVTLNGARYALYTLTVASAGTVTFDVAEYTGL